MSPRHLIRISIAAALAATQAFAADPPPPPDLANWKCEMCPFDKGYDGSLTVGAAYADGANASYGRYYNGMDHQGAYADIGAVGDYVGDSGRHAEYAIDDAGLSSRRGLIRAGTYGLYDVTLRYDGIIEYAHSRDEDGFVKKLTDHRKQLQTERRIMVLLKNRGCNGIPKIGRAHV